MGFLRTLKGARHVKHVFFEYHKIPRTCDLGNLNVLEMRLTVMGPWRISASRILVSIFWKIQD
jgi:hypothetical protein